MKETTKKNYSNRINLFMIGIIFSSLFTTLLIKQTFFVYSIEDVLYLGLIILPVIINIILWLITKKYLKKSTFDLPRRKILIPIGTNIVFIGYLFYISTKSSYGMVMWSILNQIINFSIVFISISMLFGYYFNMNKLKKQASKIGTVTLKTQKNEEIEIKTQPMENIDPKNAKHESKENHIKYIEKLKQMIKVSSQLSIHQISIALKIKEEELYDLIFDWAEKYHFRIDGEMVSFGGAEIDSFITSLNEQFNVWNDQEIQSIGKN